MLQVVQNTVMLDIKAGTCRQRGGGNYSIMYTYDDTKYTKRNPLKAITGIIPTRSVQKFL